MEKSTILECKNLSVGYPKQTVASGVSFCLETGGLCYVTGDNGSGKTTLLSTLLGQIPAVSGAYAWMISEQCISHLPQKSNLIVPGSITVAEILGLYEGLYDEELFTSGFKYKKWNDLSGGEKQRLLITTKLKKSTRCLVLDEPFNHLDRKTIGLLNKSLSEITRRGVTVIIVSHQIPEEIPADAVIVEL